MEIRKKVFGEEHPAYATVLDNLANLYQDLGQYTKAERFPRRQSLEIRKRSLGPSYSTYATGLVNLAGLYKKTGSMTRPSRSYLEAIEIDLKTLGEMHPADDTPTLNNLAVSYVDMERYAGRQKSLYRKAIEIRERAFGETDHGAAASMGGLARVRSLSGDDATAAKLYHEVLGSTPSHCRSCIAWVVRSPSSSGS